MTGLRILIVDDYFIARQVIANALRDLNITDVEVATDGQVALQMIEAAQQTGKPFDVVFLDRNMPVMEGIEVLRQVRSKPAHAGTAFIIVSAATEQQEVLEMVKAGADAFIGKPVSSADVTKKFQDVMDKRKGKAAQAG